MKIKEEVANLNHELIELRRDFHMHPELGFEERRTSKVVSDYLESLGLEVKSGIAKTGVVGLLRGKKAGGTILLRADMDALPIQEENEIPYKSISKGKMHACGHDGHSAMLLVAAKILCQHKDEINGNIKFVFQPAEETAGARFMIEEGVLEDPHVDAALGLHLETPLKSGEIGITAGPLMAGADYFKLTIQGRGGHTGAPYSSIDPIIAAANVITAVQIIQTREIDVLKRNILIMFGRIEGGVAPNCIPEKVELEGTVRYLHRSAKEEEKKFERIIAGICEAYRTKYELEFMRSNRSLSNDSKMAELVRSVAQKLVPRNHIVSDIREMSGEDFSVFASKVPSTFYLIGTGNKEKETNYPHHHPRFNIDEDTLSTGVEMHVRTALAYLSSNLSP